MVKHSKIFLVKVIPNAPKNVVEETAEGTLKIRIKAVPEKGKANEELIKVLAEYLNISKKDIKILSGHTSRLKKIEIII